MIIIMINIYTYIRSCKQRNGTLEPSSQEFLAFPARYLSALSAVSALSQISQISQIATWTGPWCTKFIEVLWAFCWSI